MNITSLLPAGWQSVFTESDRKIAIGVDPATTTKRKSNPTAIAVAQLVQLTVFIRVALRFKTDDPRVTTAVIRELATKLPHGLKARRVNILATNERFFASSLKRELAGIVPVDLVIESEKTTYLGVEMPVKMAIGNMVVNQIDDGYLAVADEEWVKKDLRQTTRDRGTFLAEPDEMGNHADLFCAIGAALRGLLSKGGAAEASATPVGGTGRQRAHRRLLNPLAHLHRGSGAKVHV